MTGSWARRAVLEIAGFWRGETPLHVAFWGWAVAGGIIVNVISSAGFLLLMMAKQTALAVAVGYLLSVPYNILVCFGVWRSAEHHAREHPRDRRLAEMATATTIVGMVLLSVT